MDFESNEDILRDLMDNIRTLHEENARLMQEVEQNLQQVRTTLAFPNDE